MNPLPLGTHSETDDLRNEIKELRACMLRAQKLMEVPAAEYVPALNDAWNELQKGLFA